MEGLTKRINGGLIGIDDRKKRYAAVLKVMG
jgi:predicted chitinase